MRACICFCFYCCYRLFIVFFFKQKTAYEMRISDWSSDVCSSDLFIYEYSQDYLFDAGLPTRPVRKHAYRNLIDVNDFRSAYAQQLGDIDLQAARCTYAFLSSFDDHEIRNDWVSDVDNWKLGLDVNDPEAASPEVFMLKKQAAMQAWYEHMPVRKALLPRGGMVAMN